MNALLAGPVARLLERPAERGALGIGRLLGDIGTGRFECGLAALTAGGPLARLLEGPAERGAMGIDRLLGDVRTGRFERSLAALTAGGAVITTAEVYLSHDGASFGNKMMWWPVVIVPTLVPTGIAAVFSRRAAKTVLPIASAIVIANGLQGTYLHWRGVAQKPGGWQLAAYNLEMGPPLFAPLLSSLVGGMGLLAAVLRREGDGPAGNP